MQLANFICAYCGYQEQATDMASFKVCSRCSEQSFREDRYRNDEKLPQSELTLTETEVCELA